MKIKNAAAQEITATRKKAIKGRVSLGRLPRWISRGIETSRSKIMKGMRDKGATRPP
jgi:hypothetical protein